MSKLSSAKKERKKRKELKKKASLKEFLLESDKFENFVYRMKEASKYL